MAETTQAANACTGDCKKCNLYQRAYCSSQIAYNNMNMLAAMQETLDTAVQKMKNLEVKIETMQHEEGELVEPQQV